MNKSEYCNYLTNCLSFHQKNVRFCTTLQLGRIISEYKETPKELSTTIINLRKIQKTTIPKECEDCIYRHSQKTDTDKITRIDLFYWYHCNCGCYYCSYRDETKGEFSDRAKQGNPVIYETIKNLYKNNEISKENLQVIFGGGEIGVLKEFPKLVDLFLKNNVNNIWCETSGIKHIRAVDNILKSGKGGITVALCCGNKETYKRIKNRDKYNQVMKNLEKYLKAAKKFRKDINNDTKVVSKFIILQGFNNNYDEVEQWLKESKRIGIKKVEISMEFCWGIQTKKGQPVEQYNYDIFDYVEKRCKELNLLLKKNETSLAIMNSGKY